MAPSDLALLLAENRNYQSRRAALHARGSYDAAIPPTIAKLALPPLDEGTVVAAEDAASSFVTISPSSPVERRPVTAPMKPATCW